jgi:hypothetical protein
MRRAACALLSLLLWGCEPALLPSPSIVSVVPERVPQGGPSALSVKVIAVLPLSLDYESQSVDPAQLKMTVQLGGQEVDVPFAEADGTLVVPVPESLAVGHYDVRVALADGREVIRERAFSVVPAPRLGGEPGNGGTPEEAENGTGVPGSTFGDMQSPMSGFQLEPIGEQARDVPFKITVRATGPGAHSFQERVSIRASKGQVVSVTPGTFSEGVRVEEISLSHPNPHVYLLVEDAHGHKGLSNPFRVRPY